MCAGVRTWGAMTCRRQKRVCGCKALVRNDTSPPCHCEERSDVAIRVPAENAKKKQHLRRIRRRLRICPGSASLQCEHAASFCMSLRGAKRRGNPHLLRQHEMKSNTLGESEKHDEFALSTTDLPGSSAGMRIATPVCALVRNDRLGRCVRICPNSSQLARLLCGENGLPRRGAAAPLLAMTCRGRVSVRGCKDVVRNDRLGRCVRICLNSSQLVRYPCGVTDCHTSVRTGSQ